jgi:nucleotide-binding universal stress UspA family protein
MYSKILIPLDGSRFAESVLPYARALTNGLRLPVDLLYVDDPDLPVQIM